MRSIFCCLFQVTFKQQACSTPYRQLVQCNRKSGEYFWVFFNNKLKAAICENKRTEHFQRLFSLGLILCGAFLYRLIRHCSRQTWNRVPLATNCCLLLTYKGGIDTSYRLLTCHASFSHVAPRKLLTWTKDTKRHASRWFVTIKTIIVIARDYHIWLS